MGDTYCPNSAHQFKIAKVEMVLSMLILKTENDSTPVGSAVGSSVGNCKSLEVGFVIGL